MTLQVKYHWPLTPDNQHSISGIHVKVEGEKKMSGVRETAPQSRALIILVEDPGLITSTHMMAYNYL